MVPDDDLLVATSPPALSAGSALTEQAAPATVRIRRGTVDDWEGVRRLIEPVHGVARSMETVRWLYARNPAGPCQLWVAEDVATGTIVATRPVFPWRMRVGGQELVVRQAGDAMTHPAYQRRGLFGALVKLAWAELRDQGVPFTFSFSMPGSMSVYKKLTPRDGTGTREVLHFDRMVALLSMRSLVAQRTAVASLATPLTALYDAVQRHRMRPARGDEVFRVERFGDEFDELWARAAPHDGVLTVRDSRYLNWRFIDVPGGPFQVLGLRVDGALAGYIAFELDRRRNGLIADFFGRPEPRVLGALLRAALAAMIAQGVSKAHVWVPVESPVAALVRRVGFLPRGERYPMAVHVHRAGALADAARESARWWATFGDRDVERLVMPGA